MFLLSTIALLAFGGCAKYDGDPITQDFSIDGTYTKLEVSDAFNVTVSDQVSVVTVKAGDKIMPSVVVEVVNNTLKIRLKRFKVSYGEMQAIIPLNADLTSVNLSGASDFRSVYGLSGQKVKVSLSGASEFYCDIDADDIDMDLSGSSNINGHVAATNQLDLDLSGASNATLTGQVPTLKIDLSGSSSLEKTVVDHHYGLVCDQCSGSLSGSSNAYLHCDSTIKVSLSGSSDLHYTGNADTNGSSTTGSSNIVHDVL